MYRCATFLLSLLLLFSLPVTAVAATAPTVTLHTGSETAPLTGETLPTPAAPAGQVFAGWYAQDVLLPAGAAVPQGVTDLTALFLTMETVGSWRGDAREGFRFLTSVDRAGLDVLRTYTEVGLATLILPTTYLKAMGGVLTHATLAAAGKDRYIDLSAASFFSETHTVMAFSGSVVALLPQNQCLDYTGAGYLTVTYTNGASGRIYAPAAKGVGLYRTAVEAYAAPEDGRYTAADRTRFKGVLDSTVNLEYYLSMRETPTLLPQCSGYTTPFRSLGYNSSSETVTLQVRNGVDYRFDRDLNTLMLDGSVVAAGGAASRFHTVSEDGRTLSILYREYTANY